MCKRRIKSIILLAVMCIQIWISMVMSVDAATVNQNGDMLFSETSTAMKQKIKDEIDFQTNLIDPNIEKQLNEQGVFDIEIEGLQEEDFNIINNSESIQIATGYYYVDIDNNVGKYSVEEENELIDEIFYNGKFSKEKKR